MNTEEKYEAKLNTNSNLETGSRIRSRSTNRLRSYWQSLKKIEAIRYKNSDNRPFAEVYLFGERVLGLLDTGAAVSCIGGRLAANFIRSGAKFKRKGTLVNTADGQRQQVVGQVTADLEFKGQRKPHTLYIVPTLNQDLYLGIDFWDSFDLLPSEFRVCELSAIHELTAEQQARLMKVVELFPSFAKLGLGKTHLISHSIDVKDAKAVKQRHFPVSPAVEKLLYGEVERMMKLGVIEESDSAWSSPVVLVQKPGKVRLCLDCRKVNSFTYGDAYPLPQIEAILSRLPKAVFISSLDLKDAYWQIPLDPASRDKTAFTIPGKPLYQFKVMPFGLSNASQTMTRLMDKVIPASLRNEVFVYLDDLLVVSDSFESHLAVLTTVAEHIRQAGLTLNVEKSHFCRRTVKYLGHVIGEGVIRTDPDKISAMVDFPVPRTLKALRSFLGMTGWYSKFISNYADIAAPLTDLMRPKCRFTMTQAGLEAFEKLKKALCEAPVLHSPDFQKPFFIHCDASSFGVGGVLVQKTEGDQGDEYPIAFVSKKLNKAQKNYSVTEQECLAAIICINRFRPYVEGHHFTVITDHASLGWLMSQQDLRSRLGRWATKLQAYKFEIKHRKGKLHVVPDALSRVFEGEVEEVAVRDAEIDYESPHFNTSEYKVLADTVEANKDTVVDLKVMDGKVFRRANQVPEEAMTDQFAWKLWLPKELVAEALRIAHDSPMAAHGGFLKTLERVRRTYYWPKLVDDVRDYVGKCAVCKASKAPNQVMRPPMGKSPESQRFFQRIYVDFLGPYPRSRSGNVGIFIVLDHHTKFVFLKAVKKLSADIVVKYMREELFHTFGVPETVVSDNGTQFKGDAFKGLLREYRVSQVFTAVHSPQANASERVNRSVVAAIRSYVKPDQKNWDACLSEICCALRTAIHSGVAASPYSLVFGQQFVGSGGSYKLLRTLGLLEDRGIVLSREDSLDVMRIRAQKALQKQAEKNERIYNIRSREVSFQEGQEVYRKNFKLSNFAAGYNAKLGPRYVKARIRKKVGNSTYELEDMQGKRIGMYHAKDLRQ